MPPKLTDYELQRQQNIEANQALLQQLKLDQGATSIGFVPVATSSKPPKALKAKAQPRKSTGTKKRKRQSKGGSDDDDDDSDSSGEEVIRRASTRRTRRRMVDPNETKEEREKREEEEEKRALEEEKKMKADAERARLASMPRHRTLELWEVVAEESEPESQADSEGETGRSQRRDISDAITDGGEPDIEAPPLTDDEGISVKMEGDEDEEMSNASPRKAFSSPVSQNKDNGVLSNQGKGPNERKLRNSLEDVTRSVYPRYGIRDISGKVDPEAEDKESNDKKSGKQKLKEDMKRMRVAAIAKVTDDRIYSMAYHPDKTKDLMFFGDKHGQLGIWDPHALSPKDLEADEEEDDVKSRSKSKRKKKDRGQGQTWQLQLHWPATSKSSVSGVKFDPVSGHSVYTSSYDCSIRQTHFNAGQSDEIYALDDILISSFDFSQTGHELWISDTKGGITFLDLRADKHDARRWQLSENLKIGSISLNPTDGWSLLASCNDRSLKLWDTRQLLSMPIPTRSVSSSYDASGPIVEPYETEYDAVSDWLKGGKGKSPTKGKGRAGANGSDATLRGTWIHGYSVSSAYWDPSGTRILSTSYDDKLRVWDLPRKYLLPDEPLKSFRPAVVLDHDCQTGRWLTVFKAQWSQNPEAYPYFSIGDMKHSLKLFAADGELLADLRDKEKITAVQAVTATHPAWTNRAGTGNASGKCIFWSGEKI